MAPDTDLYAILGVSKTATDEEIRQSYRKLAREHHPDVNPGKPAAEETFKRVASAYDVLSNKEKRALYDEFGAAALQGGFDPEKARTYRQWAERSDAGRRVGGDGEVPFDFDLSDLMGRRRGRQADSPRDGEDLRTEVQLDLATALRGAELELRVPTRHPCEVCAGLGAQPGAPSTECPTCHGAGRTPVILGPMRMVSTCPRCDGLGQTRAPCTACHGEGTVSGEQTLKIRIPAGADEGDELRVRGKGVPGRFGGTPGDVIIRTHVTPHPHFQRSGLDLTVKLPITLGEARRGGPLQVPTPTGPVQMKVPPRTQQGAQLRLKGKGVARGSARGDLYVVLEVRLPDSDDAALTELLNETDRFYAGNLRDGVEL